MLGHSPTVSPISRIVDERVLLIRKYLLSEFTHRFVEHVSAHLRMALEVGTEAILLGTLHMWSPH